QVMNSLVSLDEEQGPRVKAAADQIERWLNGLPGLRKLIVDNRVPARAALGTYTRLIADLNTLFDEIGRDSGDDRLFGDAAALGALSRAKEQQSIQRGILTVALIGGSFDYDNLTDFNAAWKRGETELASFQAEATPADARVYANTVRGSDVDK